MIKAFKDPFGGIKGDQTFQSSSPFKIDKEQALKEIQNSKSKNINDKYINFSILKNENKINIFFDKKTLNLVGWQTEDIYQNLVITFISNIKINKKIDKNIFKLPRAN